MVNHSFSTLRRYIQALAVVAIMLTLPSTAFAQQQTLGSSSSTPCRPIEIQVTPTLERIFDVNLRQSTFKAIFGLQFKSPTPSQDNVRVGEIYQTEEFHSLADQLYQPVYRLLNAHARPDLDYSYAVQSREQGLVLTHFDRIIAEAIIEDANRFFPFGKQTLILQIELLNNQFKPERQAGCRLFTITPTDSPIFSVSGPWRAQDRYDATLVNETLTITAEISATASLSMVKVLVPLLFIIFASMSANLLIGKESDLARWNIAQITLYLVLVSWRFSIDHTLPQTAGITLAGYLFLNAVILVTIATIGNVCFQVLANANGDNIHRLKSQYRRIMIAAYAFMIAVSVVLFLLT